MDDEDVDESVGDTEEPVTIGPFGGNSTSSRPGKRALVVVVPTCGVKGVSSTVVLVVGR